MSSKCVGLNNERKQRNINWCFHINKIYLFLHSSHIFYLKVSNIWLGWCVFGIVINLPLRKHSKMGSKIVLTIGIKYKSWAQYLLTLHILGSETIIGWSIYSSITYIMLYTIVFAIQCHYISDQSISVLVPQVNVVYLMGKLILTFLNGTDPHYGGFKLPLYYWMSIRCPTVSLHMVLLTNEQTSMAQGH